MLIAVWLLHAGSPQIYVPPVATSVTRGSLLKLTCSIKGRPSPTASWTRNGITLTQSSRITIRYVYTSLITYETQVISVLLVCLFVWLIDWFFLSFQFCLHWFFCLDPDGRLLVDWLSVSNRAYAEHCLSHLNKLSLTDSANRLDGSHNFAELV